VNSAAGRCAIAYCAKLYRVPARRENVAYIEPDMFPKQLGFKSGGLRHLEAMHEWGSLTPLFVNHLKQAIVLEPAGVMRALPRRFIDHNIG